MAMREAGWKAELERLSRPVPAIGKYAEEMTGAHEPVRMRTWIPAFNILGVESRREWLRLHGVDERKMHAPGNEDRRLSDDEILDLELVEVPCPKGTQTRCRPDLAIIRREGSRTWAFVVIEAKIWAEIHWGWISCLGVTNLADLPVELQDRAWLQNSRFKLCQLDIYRWAGHWIYPADWDMSVAQYVLLRPPGDDQEQPPKEWIIADLIAVTMLLLEAAKRTGRDEYARAVAGIIAPPGTYRLRGIPISGPILSYASFGVRRSWDVWKRKVKVIYLYGSAVGVAITPRGWWPVSLDGSELDLSDVDPKLLDEYAEMLECHGDRAGWRPCRYEGCGADIVTTCDHVDWRGSKASTSLAKVS